MKKAELETFIGKPVKVTFCDGSTESGILGFAKDFSALYGYRHVNMFYINHTSFRVSHVKWLEELSR